MTKEEFKDRIETIACYNNQDDYHDMVEELWQDLQRAKKSQQRAYQRRIKALVEQN